MKSEWYITSLNPYCSGIWSRSIAQKCWKLMYQNVLILIVVEYGLGEVDELPNGLTSASLNPYCSGIWSRSRTLKRLMYQNLVLILIVVEYGLGEV